jgi:hypothetical protein
MSKKKINLSLMKENNQFKIKIKILKQDLRQIALIILILKLTAFIILDLNMIAQLILEPYLLAITIPDLRLVALINLLIMITSINI